MNAGGLKKHRRATKQHRDADTGSSHCPWRQWTKGGGWSVRTQSLGGETPSELGLRPPSGECLALWGHKEAGSRGVCKKPRDWNQ